MKKRSPAFTLVAALLLAPIATTFAQGIWHTVADFECPHPTGVDALARDADGKLYAAVSAADARGRRRALVHKSSDFGATWAVAEDFAAADRDAIRLTGLGASVGNVLYAVGYATDEKAQTRWIVRQSAPDGRSWSTVDDFAYPLGRDTTPQGIAVDGAGTLYVAGYGEELPAAGKMDRRLHWLVRQSRDGGRSWSTIDDFSYSFSARATTILNTPGGLLVAGSGWNGKTDSGERWLVRKGTPDSAGSFHWQTVDEFQLKEDGHGFDSRAHGLGADAGGNLYAVGRSATAAGEATSVHWIVRRASSSGSDWATVDTYQLESGRFAAACGVAAHAPGGVYVVGKAAGANFGSHWIVRQSASGEAGSWSVCDDLQRGAAASASSTDASTFKVTTDGSLIAWPPANSSGQTILSHPAGIFVGGSVSTETAHAVVRKLELGRPSELTDARRPVGLGVGFCTRRVATAVAHGFPTRRLESRRYLVLGSSIWFVAGSVMVLLQSRPHERDSKSLRTAGR